MLPENGPSPQQIADQLERMLASNRFRNASTQSEFLALVVREALKGKKTRGSFIRDEMFFEKSEEDVRATAYNLRKTLKKYRANEGREDLVVIALREPPPKGIKLPEGEAYTPEFSFNPNHAVSREVRLGEYFHRRGTLEGFERAYRHFSNALAICPLHIDAAIGVYEAWSSLSDWRGDVPEKEPVERAAEIINSAWSRRSNYWRLYALIGRVHMMESQPYASAHFAKALILDRASTEAYRPYIEFLANSGDKSEALRLAKNYLDGHEDDIFAYITYAKVLGKMEKYLEAEAILMRALDMDKSNAFVQFYAAQCQIWRSRPRQALPHLQLMKALLDTKTFQKIAPLLAERMPRKITKDLLLGSGDDIDFKSI